jgi:hypothetical protein
MSIGSIVEKYYNDRFPDLLSLDVEGLDFEVISSIDFKKYQPKVICVETISYSKNGTGVKSSKLIKYVESKGYYLYADTNINTIFVKKDLWVRK